MMPDRPVIHLCNACPWGGLEEETAQMKHGHPNHLCPECHETTEAFDLAAVIEMAQSYLSAHADSFRLPPWGVDEYGL